MEKTTKYYIKFGYEDGSGKIYQLETRRFDTKEEALDWYHSSFVTADTWNCFMKHVKNTRDFSHGMN